MIRLTVINLTNSPCDLEGGIHLPAMGRVTEEFDENYAAALRLSPGVEVHDAPEAEKAAVADVGSKPSKTRSKRTK